MGRLVGGELGYIAGNTHHVVPERGSEKGGNPLKISAVRALDQALLQSEYVSITDVPL